MFVTINGNRLNVEVMGPEDGTLIIAHHGAPGLGTLTEPRNTFGPLSDTYRVVVFDARVLVALTALVAFAAFTVRVVLAACFTGATAAWAAAGRPRPGDSSTSSASGAFWRTESMPLLAACFVLYTLLVAMALPFVPSSVN